MTRTATTGRPRLATTAALMATLLAAAAVNAQQSPAPTGSEDSANAREQALQQRVDDLEKRLSELESSAVLSEPETRVRKIEVYVDKDGNETDTPTPGSEKVVTYQRERVFRRQTISEKIDEALADEAERSVQLGIDAAMVVQQVNQTRGTSTEADGHAYALSSADLYFSAKLAQNTSLYADVVGLSGSPPDGETGGLTLLNGYAARLVRQNEINLREAWLRTELFDQNLALTIGRLDLTAFFDRNAVANDETSQFVGDALVNNPMLGLSSNGAGLAAVYDPRGSWNLKLGVQQSETDATNLSQSLFSLGEIGYRARPRGLGEGNYRGWYRTDNSSGDHKDAFGLSVDQRLTPAITVFGRYGSEQAVDAATGHDHFFSGGLQLQTHLVLNPLDTWGLGYARLKMASDDQEQLLEAYYNLHLSEKLHLSLHLQYATDTDPVGAKRSYLVPGVRIQAGL